MVKPCVPVRLITLVVLHPADLNVLLALIARETKPVQIRSVEIHVLEHVVCKRSVTLSITIQFVLALNIILAIHLSDAP